MNNVLLRRSLEPKHMVRRAPEQHMKAVAVQHACTHSNPGLELGGGDDGNGAAVFPKLML